APVPKNEISPVAKLVIKAYKQNDSVAKHIIGEAADDMVTGILTLSNKLFPKSVSVPVVLCGGVFHDKTVLPVMMREKIRSQTDRLTLLLPRISPVGGSVIG